MLVLILSALLAAASTATAGAQPAKMRTVHDPAGRFSISFPTEWRVETSAGGTPSVIGVAPSQTGEFRVNVNVVVETLSTPISPQALAQIAAQQLRTIFHEFTVVQEGRAEIGGHSAYYRYYTWRTNTDVSIYQVQVYFTTGLTGFVITGSMLNDPDRIGTDMPVIARVINSFRPAGEPPAGGTP